MTRCTWPVEGQKDKQECGNRACNAWQRTDSDELLPRCQKHLFKEAVATADEAGYRLVPA